MFAIKRRILLATLIALTLLSACTLGQTPEPTPTAVDVNAIYTAAAATAQSQLTEIAGLASPTPPPTQTPEATATVQVTISISVENTLPAATQPAGLGLPTATLPLGVIVGTPTLTPIPTLGTGGNTGPVCKLAGFEGDVTIPDGTQFKAWEKFYKVWRFSNRGTCAWDEGFSFKSFAGANMGGDPMRIKQESQFIAPGAVVDIGRSMFAPGDPGEYVTHWSWFDDLDKAFPVSVTVVIKVVK
jgi:hypothetical protein